MKNILLSTRPKWCEKIVNGEKTIEVRKTAPKEVPFKAYIYETYDKKYDDIGICWGKEKCFEHGCKKVIGEFICDKVDEYTFSHYEAEYRVTHVEQKAMCLNQPELIRYGKGKTLYGWHISDLKIYDKPKDLSEFFKPCPTKEKGDCLSCDCLADNDYGGVCTNNLTRPPQSYIFVEEIETSKEKQ